MEGSGKQVDRGTCCHLWKDEWSISRSRETHQWVGLNEGTTQGLYVGVSQFHCEQADGKEWCPQGLEGRDQRA